MRDDVAVPSGEAEDRGQWMGGRDGLTQFAGKFLGVLDVSSADFGESPRDYLPHLSSARPGLLASAPPGSQATAVSTSDQGGLT